jgi:hypothetical protein
MKIDSENDEIIFDDEEAMRERPDDNRLKTFDKNRFAAAEQLEVIAAHGHENEADWIAKYIDALRAELVVVKGQEEIHRLSIVRLCREFQERERKAFEAARDHSGAITLRDGNLTDAPFLYSDFADYEAARAQSEGMNYWKYETSESYLSTRKP